MRPLPYGGIIAIFDNHPAPESPAGLATLFRYCLVGFDGGPAAIKDMPAGRPDVLERAILEASGLLDPSDAEENDSDEPESDDREHAQEQEQEQEPPAHSVMSGSEADKRDAVREELEEYQEADLVYQLHDHGYRYDELYSLLMPEIDQLMDGIERERKRERIRRQEQDSGSGSNSGPNPGSNGSAPNQNGNDSTPVGGQGSRGASAGDQLF